MRSAAAIAVLVASPAAAATGPFFSLANTDFVVLLAFLVFIGILVYFKVPQRLAGLLDARATSIRSDLDEAKAIREEAQALLASYERKQREATAQVDRIVAHARTESSAAADQAKVDMERAIERRLKTAEEQIDQARASAVREVRDRAIRVAVAAASDVIRSHMSDEQSSALIDQSIDTVGAKLH